MDKLGFKDEKPEVPSSCCGDDSAASHGVLPSIVLFLFALFHWKDGLRRAKGREIILRHDFVNAPLDVAGRGSKAEGRSEKVEMENLNT